MPLDELKKLVQNNVTRQAARRQPQTNDDLRQLFRLALTTPKSAPEEVALADARIKLQGARNVAYSLELKDRVTKLRVAVAHAERHPAPVIAQRNSEVRQAELELAAAEAFLELDIKSISRAKLAVTTVTGYTFQDSHDPELDANTARRDAMLDEITAMIKKYEAMEPVVHEAKDKVQVHFEAVDRGKKRKRSAS
jgi:hypothetical protein